MIKPNKKIITSLLISVFVCSISQFKGIKSVQATGIPNLNPDHFDTFANTKDRYSSFIKVKPAANSLVKKSTTFPAKYDLRSLNLVTSVKNQGYIGSCWDFAAIASLESTLKKDESGSNYDFSENNLLTHNEYSLPYDKGGNRDMAAGCFSKWAGPVLESADPYSVDGTDANVIIRNNVSNAKHVQNVIYLPTRFTDTSDPSVFDNSYIKQAITTYGAVDSSLCWADKYYNPSTYSYYDNNADSANHDIAIVGWNDNYSKDNFGVTPPGDGAFLCKNSWGTNFGDSGYFYISYYDLQIGDEGTVFKAEATNNYYNNYQYDPLGATGYSTYYQSVYCANVFTSDSLKNEKLAAVGFYTIAPSNTYDIYIATDYNTNSFSKMVDVKSGTLADAGFHTINLNSLISIVPGNKFAVIVKLTNTNGVTQIATEKPLIGYSDAATSNPGESYVSGDGQNFVDVYTSGSTVTNKNFCIKAYTASGLMGDVNNDSKVSITDLAEEAQYYGKKVRTVALNPKYDLNSDGIVDIYDLVKVAKNLK